MRARFALLSALFVGFGCTPASRLTGLVTLGPDDGGPAVGGARPSDAAGRSGDEPGRDAGAAFTPEVDAGVPPARDAASEAPAPPVPATVFAGTSTEFAKLVPTDPAPGYAYVAHPLSATVAPTVAAVELEPAERSGLPAGVAYALRNVVSSTGRTLLITGFNYRADDGPAWRWLDASGYVGLRFWARATTGPLDLNLTSIDASNVLASDPRRGACAADPCPAVAGKSLRLGGAWTEHSIRWTDLSTTATPRGPVQVSQLGRVDVLWRAPDTGRVQWEITAVELFRDSD